MPQLRECLGTADATRVGRVGGGHQACARRRLCSKRRSGPVWMAEPDRGRPAAPSGKAACVQHATIPGIHGSAKRRFWSVAVFLAVRLVQAQSAEAQHCIGDARVARKEWGSVRAVGRLRTRGCLELSTARTRGEVVRCAEMRPGLYPKASRSVFGMSTCTRHRRLRVCKEHNLSIGMTPEQRRVGVQDLDSARADSRPSMLWSLNSTPPVRCIDGPLSCVGLGMGSSRVRGVPSAVPISANQIYHRQFPHVPHLLTQGCCRRRSPALPSCTSASTSCARHHGAHT